MIPYETIRSHLERRHRTGTADLTWEAMVTIHEQQHEQRSGSDCHQTPLPLVVAAERAR